MPNQEYYRTCAALQKILDDPTVAMTPWRIEKLRSAITSVIAGDYDRADELLLQVRQGQQGEEPSGDPSMARAELKHLFAAVTGPLRSAAANN